MFILHCLHWMLLSQKRKSVPNNKATKASCMVIGLMDFSITLTEMDVIVQIESVLKGISEQ